MVAIDFEHVAVWITWIIWACVFWLVVCAEPALIAKSNIILEVKPWDDETDMKELEKCVRNVQTDGLVWGVCKCTHFVIGIFYVFWEWLSQCQFDSYNHWSLIASKQEDLPHSAYYCLEAPQHLKRHIEYRCVWFVYIYNSYIISKVIKMFIIQQD
jgi:hypothetical protein